MTNVQESTRSSPESGIEDESIEQDVVADGGYGWVCVGCLMAVNASSWGINTIYGVYSSYFIEHNYYHASRLDYAWVGGLSVAVSALSSPLANFLTQQFGFRIPMLFGATCMCLGQCMAGICTSFGTFLVCQGVVFGLGLGQTLVPGYPLLAHWFNRRLSVAQGISNAGSGIGALVLSYTTARLLESVGVKWTMIINGCISAILAFPAILLLRGRHSHVKAREVPLQPKFWIHPGYRWVLIWAAFTMMSYYITIYSVASYATDGLGLTQTQAGTIQSCLAAGQIVGRPFWGFAMDRGGRINMTIVNYLICGTAIFAVWLPSRSYGILALYAVLAGLTGGTIMAATTPISTSIVGVQDLASALSTYWLTLAGFSLVSQPIAILLVNYSHTSLAKTGADAYTISICLTGSFSIVAALALYGGKRYLQGSWKVIQKT